MAALPDPNNPYAMTPQFNLNTAGTAQAPGTTTTPPPYIDPRIAANPNLTWSTGPSPFTPAPGAANPVISTAQGANTPGGMEDLWFQFINSQGYATGPGSQGTGFYAGGQPYRNNLQPLVEKFNQMTGQNAKVVSGDKIDFGRGPQDVITSGGDWWMGNVNGAPGPPNGAPGPTPGAVSTGGAVTGGGGLPSGMGSPDAQSLFDLLMQRAKQSEVIDPNDPVLKAQTDAFRAEQTQDARNMQSAAAESAGPGPTNLDAINRSTGEKVGQNTSAFQAGLMGQELIARRAEIQDALTGAAGLLTAEQTLALNQELGLIDAQIRKDALAQQAYQYDTSNFYEYGPLGPGGA